MVWYGFGFNGFGQIYQLANPRGVLSSGEKLDVKVLVPVKISACGSHGTSELKNQDENGTCKDAKVVQKRVQIKASWSRRCCLYSGDDGHVCLSGFGAPDQRVCTSVLGYCGCRDAVLTERLLILGFSDRAECWELDGDSDVPVWKTELDSLNATEFAAALPLVQGGYIGAAAPIFHPLSPQLHAASLALGVEHAILLTASGDIYTWGLGSHGQLGHGGLDREAEPRIVEALWGVSMEVVAAGSWHSVCVSTGGDVYTWGWNESGQLGMPAQGIDRERHCSDYDRGTHPEANGEKDKGVFISIQAFPALVDLPGDPEVKKVSCGSRHTAVVTGAGDLFTWGWGDYGQLGHGVPCSSDQPSRVDFFAKQGLSVVDVVCGSWNTFVSVVEREPPCT